MTSRTLRSSNRVLSVPRWAVPLAVLASLAAAVLTPCLAENAAAVPIPNAIQFPIVFKTQLDSTHAKDGDPVKAALKEDLTIDEELIAPAGSLIIGHIEKLRRSRRLTESMFSSNRRFHKGSSLKVTFDEIITPEHKHLLVVGCLSKQSISFIEADQPRQVEIGANGELKRAEAVFTTQQKVASGAVNFAASTGLNQLGTAASFGALPVVMGVVGAVNPAMVMSKPMNKEEKHPRMKGFAMGVFTSLPGAPVMQAFAFKGSELRIEPGDEFLAQAHSPYEPAPVLSISSKILPRDARDAKDAKDAKDSRNSQNSKDAKDANDAKDPKHLKNTKVSQLAKDSKDAKDGMDAKEPKSSTPK